MGVPAPALRVLSDGDVVRVLWEEVAFGERSITIERPEDPGSLIQGWCNLADPDVLIPYWAEIWPSSPWSTPSGSFARTLGVGLVEWGIPLPPGATFRLPKPAEFEMITADAAGLLRRAVTQAR